VTENGDAPALLDRSEFKYFRCDGLVCTNPEFEERNRTRWTTALIPNGVDTDRFSPGPGRRGVLGLPRSAPVVLMVSALIESKHVAAGIRAVSGLDDAFLLLVGDGPLRLDIDRLANELLPGRYRRITVSADQMPDLYRSADVLLHMSQTESFGNVYIEAMCSGLPVVAHNTRTTRWIFGEYPGLVDTEDATAVAMALRAASDTGSTFTARLVEQASTRFSWTTVSEQYQAFLERVLVDG
jgi:glycosyltransferase involved in cell wall biosynthesis